MSLDPARLAPMANAIRALAMDAVQAANSGHPGMPMGMADVATVLFDKYLKFDPAAPGWPDRDRFILSAGHGSMLLYALLYLTGYDAPTIDDIRTFRQLHSPCAGHPENIEIDGVECTTGPLGQGLAMAVGMAIAERHLNAEFGDDLVDHNTWTVAGDGCLMEGINHEAVGLAGHLALNKLKVLWDSNKITIDGATSLSTCEDVLARYRASGWDTFECDGHDYADIDRALGKAARSAKPAIVACHTIIGKGAPNKQGSEKVHGSALGADEVAAARKELLWTAEPFAIPDGILADWRSLGERGALAHEAWAERARKNAQGDAYAARMAGDLPLLDGWHAYKAELTEKMPNVATRKASENALTVLTKAVPALIGGSADLTPSNNTMTPSTGPMTAEDYSGRYLHYGIREFGMAAAMNGMALHGGIIPYGGTFLVFSDYCRNAIRLAALQQAHTTFVFTHDSIGLGEDGPTHQPIEHLAALRAIPGLKVYRPADALETAECWELALERKDGPSLLALSRQNLPALRNQADANLCAKGAYKLVSAAADRRVVLLATGSEVHLAVECAQALEADGIGADVVSMPCWELYDSQDETYKSSLIPEGALAVSIEAGSTMGWHKYVGRDGLTIGLDHFGLSAPAEDLFPYFGFTSSAIVPQIKRRLGL
ncbi:transketolase [Parablastomonas sp. CN1-191]|uniref:transketolase n=1 Tax=Parablastomonas sp. CN1-191 TaxID=3400908 RepID=UPI003BF87350